LNFLILNDNYQINYFNIIHSLWTHSKCFDCKNCSRQENILKVNNFDVTVSMKITILDNDMDAQVEHTEIKIILMRKHTGWNKSIKYWL
jgi:hypothetical protein